MIRADLPKNEKDRLVLLKQLGLLDSSEEKLFDNITALASEICDTPISLISLVDENRQWFKSRHGIEAKETPRDVSFCSHAILGTSVFNVSNAREDERFRDNPLVTGEPNIVFYAGAPLSLPSGHKLGTLCVIDHKERHLTDSQVRQLELLAQQVVDFFLLKSKESYLNLIDDYKRQWLANLSHDLRKPTSSLITLSFLMKEQFDTLSKEDILDFSSRMVRSSEKLLSLLDDVVDLCQVESDAISFYYEDINVEDLIHDLVYELEALVLSYKSDIKVNPPNESPIFCHTDSKRLSQVLTNLITNAAKYSDENSTIEIGIRKSNQTVRIIVTNRGQGIQQEEMSKLFKQFSQVNNMEGSSLAPTKGFGLGLYLSKLLIEKMGGTIMATSIPGQTTSFTVSLPLKQ